MSKVRETEAIQPHRNGTPPVFRPFFGLRIQLTFIYSLLLILVVILTYLQDSWPKSATLGGTILIGIIAFGIFLAFLLTTVLLQPLWHVTDTAQAIAQGDLKQHERLPFRLPPQDEFDRLAESLHMMVTQLEHAEEVQGTSTRRFQRFFSDASHQLRTPLTSLRGFTEVLLRGAKDDPETMQRVLKLMKNEGERMTYLINDLLTLSRLDDSHSMKMQHVDLVQLAKERIDYVKMRTPDERNITLCVATQGNLSIQGNEEYLRQLLFILLDNAVKYGYPAPEGRITVDLNRQNERVVVRVIDNGEGIKREDLEHVFDSFYRGKHQQDSPIIGTGLGLTIANAIVHAHKGTISVQSEPKTRTVFTINLPCTQT
jgi:two-component system OmpR family sensor kinase